MIISIIFILIFVHINYVYILLFIDIITNDIITNVYLHHSVHELSYEVTHDVTTLFPVYEIYATVYKTITIQTISFT